MYEFHVNGDGTYTITRHGRDVETFTDRQEAEDAFDEYVEGEIQQAELEWQYAEFVS